MNPTDPAFPLMHVSDSVSRLVGTGMDLRTYMATACLQGFLATTPSDECPKLSDLADDAVRLADALIERLNEK